MNHGIKIRAANLSDKAQIEKFLRQMNLRSEDILAPNTQYWVAESDCHTLVGSAGLEFGVDSGLLRSVAVSPEFRNIGLGGELVNTAMAFAKTKGCKNIFLFSVSSGKYWQKIGFQAVPFDDLIQALPNSPQVIRFRSIGKLATETGSKKN